MAATAVIMVGMADTVAIMMVVTTAVTPVLPLALALAALLVTAAAVTPGIGAAMVIMGRL